MGALAIAYQEKVCYICRRSMADLDNVRKLLEDQLEKDTNEAIHPLQKRIEEKKREISEKYGKNDGIPDGPTLEFDVAAVSRDLPKFRKLVPEVDDLLAFHEEYLKRGSSPVRNPTLLEIRNRISNASVPEIDIIQKKIDEYRQRRVLGIAELHEKTIDIGLVKGMSYPLEMDDRYKIKFTIYVCDICSTLLKEASAAAYLARNADHHD